MTGRPANVGATRTESGCWEWTGTRTAAGYGVRAKQYAHRVAYVHRHGSIPEGLEIDHLCRNRACFNPDHLEAVTHAENMRRGHFGSKTECPEGHPYDEANTIINASNGGRACRECVRRRKREAYRRANPEVKAQAARTHCPQGHPLSGENLYSYPDGRRGCRICKKEQTRASARRRYHEKKAEAA